MIAIKSFEVLLYDLQKFSKEFLSYKECFRKEHEKCEFETYEVYGVDVLVSTGDGKVKIISKFLQFFNQVFQGKNPVFEMMKMHGRQKGRRASVKGKPYCTNNYSPSFQDMKLMFCRSIVHNRDMHITRILIFDI